MTALPISCSCSSCLEHSSSSGGGPLTLCMGLPAACAASMHHMTEALIWTCRAGRQLTLSLEMFERDVQGVMDEYLAGSITERDLRQVRCLSSNHMQS